MNGRLTNAIVIGNTRYNIVPFTLVGIPDEVSGP